MVATTISQDVQGTYVVGDAGLTPHSPARLVFKGGLRKVMVRQLKTQASLPASLPHGPLQQQEDPFDPLVEMYRTTDQNYTDLTKRTLSILQGLIGQDAVAKGKEGQWADGPKFVWRDLSSPKANDRVKSNPSPEPGVGRPAGSG